MWAFMIFAMMLPTLLPTLSSKIMCIKKWFGFLLGYLAVWLLFCLGCIFIQWVLHSNGLLSDEMVITNSWFTSLLLALVGIYQFSRIKVHSCIARNQLLISSMETSGGIGFNLQVGTKVGTSCAISCGPLMLAMFAFGLMNVIAMLVLTVMMFVETNFFYGENSNRFIGVVALAYAAFSLKGMA